MESLQGLKSRLGAVKNVGTITKAMEVVSATKMRKSQEVALRTRPYAIEALDMLRKITKHVANGDNGRRTTPWTSSDVQKSKKTLLVLVASDRGLAGSFNAQVLRAADAHLATGLPSGNPVAAISVLAIGKKAQRWALKNNLEIAGEFSGFDDVVDFDEVLHVANTVLEGFEAGQWDRVVTISTHFRTALKQEVLMREILPTNPEKIEETIDELVPERGRYANLEVPPPSKDLDVARPLGRPTSKADEVAYLLEPSAEAIIDELVPYLIRMQMYHLILEANASEHSARRVAMKTACDNADELAENLTLFYNKARQAAITKEIIEISGTQNALEAA